MKALARDPRCSVVISSAGVDNDVSQTITFKGQAILHKDQETKDWFYPDFARHANSPAPTPEDFVAFLDTSARIIIEVVPEDGFGIQERFKRKEKLWICLTT